MLLYDARGRLVRAFPTFQFFFVDEGRWLTYNRLWDNLYGYNSVASLDVHKSRMSPADTLQVELNNSYNTISKNDSSSYKDDGIDFLQFIGIEKVTDDLIQERKKTLNQLYIKPGCRVHLKMGYGSDPTMLPIVFNGTITEIDVKDVTTITAQGDGVELTNKIEAEYGDTSGGTVTAGNEEPRNLILWLLDDRSFFDKWVTEDKFKMKTTPKGVVHFGNTKYHPWKQDEAEVGQNIYTVVLSDDQADRETVQGSWDWVGLLSPKNDEPNLKMYVYDKTAWDIITICRMVDPEYIAAVHPFELRSTLYVGKPYWKMAYGYTTNGAIDEKGNVSQYGVKELKKTFQQYRIYNSATDIVMNEIRASEDGVYTNVVAMYSTGEEDNPNKSILVSADTDIYPEKQKTTIVNSEIKGGKIPNAWGADRIANGIVVSALVDSMKLMYKGNMIVLGDPTAKPYDLMYVQDTYKRINGTSEIRECTLSMSRETGFITSIQPDACVSSIDKWKVNRATWLGAGLGVTVGTNLLLRAVDVHATRAIARAIATPALNTTKATLLKGSQLLMTDQATNIMNKSYSTVYNRVTQTVVDFKAKGLLKADSKMVEGVGNIFKKLGITATENFTDDIAKAAMSGAVTKVKGIISAGKEIPILAGIFAGAAGTTGAVALAAVVLPAVAEAAVWYIVTESLLELFQRRLQNRQAVTIIPLKLYGKEFTAGIYGHRGCVVGDTQGDVDKALSKLSWIFGESHSYTYEMGKDYDQEKETYNVTDQTGGE
jgi:hypothetical protein